MRTLRIATVIPTFNEADNLAQLLPSVLGYSDQVIVCDGGSTDGSLAVAERRGVILTSAPRGRGSQLRAGAAAADTDVLIFLHADTYLDRQSIPTLRRALADGAVGGGFFLRFSSPKPIFHFGAKLVNLRTRATQAPLGDQAQFVLRSAYEEIGGIRDWPVCEDLDFIRRLKRRGPIALLSPPVVTSARRYEAGGIARTVFKNWLIWAGYFAGIAPEKLARLYGPGR